MAAILTPPGLDATWEAVELHYRVHGVFSWRTRSVSLVPGADDLSYIGGSLLDPIVICNQMLVSSFQMSGTYVQFLFFLVSRCKVFCTTLSS